MELRYDSAITFRTPEDLVFRLRLWTDPSLRKPPILMASQAPSWVGVSVVNASEDIYAYFLRQPVLAMVKEADQEVIWTSAGFSFSSVLAKLQEKFISGLFNAGNMDDMASIVTWLGPKVVPCLGEVQQVISEYVGARKSLRDAYQNMLFVEHYPARPQDVVQDWFTKEKFFVVSHANGSRDQQCIVMTHGAMASEFGITGI